MIIKKYQGKTEAEAVEQARKELGDGVVILSSRNTKRKGFFSVFFPTVVEITAALEDEGSLPKAQGSQQSAGAKASPTQTFKGEKPQTGAFAQGTQPALSGKAIPGKAYTDGVAGGSAPSIQPGLKPSGGLLPDELIAQSIPEALRDKDPITSTKSSEKAQTAPPAKEAQKPEVTKDSGIEQRLDNLQNLIEQQILPRAGIDPASASVKEQGSRLTDAPIQDNKPPTKENDSFIKLLYDTMIDNEVSPENANIIIREIEGSTRQGQSIDHLLANVYQKMILKFGKSVGIRPAEKGVKVLFFVGPTGVGKTTTIAKIASRFRVEEKKKVALLTADTYRIAAAEQLATYANILDVPFRIVYTPGDMTGYLTEYVGYDYVLVDTPGHSHYNEVQKESMNQFIHSVDGVASREVFLVLSATTKYRDLLHIADAYRDMTDYKLIFTKLDETETLGNLLNLKLYTGTEISYVTCGQNVPDDIENFNPQKTVKQLLGGKRAM